MTNDKEVGLAALRLERVEAGREAAAVEARQARVRRRRLLLSGRGLLGRLVVDRAVSVGGQRVRARQQPRGQQQLHLRRRDWRAFIE